MLTKLSLAFQDAGGELDTKVQSNSVPGNEGEPVKIPEHTPLGFLHGSGLSFAHSGIPRALQEDIPGASNTFDRELTSLESDFLRS